MGGPSLPARERGSKRPTLRHRDATRAVAPRAGAWIETRPWRRSHVGRDRRSPRGSVDRNFYGSYNWPGAKSRSPRGSVDRNTLTRRRFCRSVRSLPARERGSKPINGGDHSADALSLPARERGSKQGKMAGAVAKNCVAPRAGAWIETFMAVPLNQVPQVAPRAGAWIETCNNPDGGIGAAQVAPRAGAWIETLMLCCRKLVGRSLPARERGSKPSADRAIVAGETSLPARERGSKRSKLSTREVHDGVAPRAGAWIET